MPPRFLGLAEVVEIHEDQVARHGGLHGIRDLGLLSSAVAMPQAGVFGQYVHADLFEMAAAYLYHIVRNHPFLDGNKRVAFFATDVFLRINGWKLAVDGPAAHAFLIGLLEDGSCDFVHLVPWLRAAIVPHR